MKYRGINYDVGIDFNDSFNSRPDFVTDVVERELQIIRDDLHCTDIRLSGTDVTRLVKTAEIALGLGLGVWFAPQLHNKSTHETLAYIASCAKAAESLRVKYPDKLFFIVGCELTWFMHGIMKGDTFEQRLAKPWNLFQMIATRRFSKRLNTFLAQAAEITRQEFNGQITYAGALLEKVDWRPFDLIGLDYYRDTHNRKKYGKELAKYAQYKKPIIITEVGLCTYRGAEQKGALGHAITVKTPHGHRLKSTYARDEALQARELIEMLKILDDTSVIGSFVFLFAWPAFPYSDDPALDLDMASYSIVKTLAKGHGTTYPDMNWEPKQAFSALADYYKFGVSH